MAENDFERIKAALDIKKVITGETGLAMKGKHLEACPFCDHHKCFSIMDDRQAYKCHSCEASGDVFTFIEKHHSIDKGAALRKAADLANIKLKSRSTALAVNQSVKQRIHTAAVDYYHGKMLDKGGREYLIDTRGHDEKILQQMKVGYSDGRLLDHLKGLNFSEGDVLESGLATHPKDKNSKPILDDDGHLLPPHDFFNKNLAIFPHLSIDGKTVNHFTMKDPNKKLSYQLPKVARGKDWRFYNQAALKKDEFFILEGENDLLTLMAAGHQNVVGIIGQISGDQIATLKNEAKHKSVYLWFDNDEAGQKYIEKVAKELSAAAYRVRIIEHPGDAKDPDEYLRSLNGNRKQIVNQLKDKAVDYLTWQIRLMGRLESLDDKLRGIKDRGIFTAISIMPKADKEVMIERLERLGFSKDAIEEQIEVNRELRDQIDVAVGEAGGDINKVKINRLGGIIYDHFAAHGKFFKDKLHNVFLLYQGFTYTIGNNTPFNSLMHKSSGLLSTENKGRSIWEYLIVSAFNNGTNIQVASWSQADLRRDVIYINLNSSDNNIMMVTKDDVRIVPNGLNENDVLLQASDMIKPMEYRKEVSRDEGLKALQDLILNNLTCDLEQRYFIICWLISAFMLDFVPSIGLLKFSGRTASGKSTAAKLLSTLLYGDSHLSEVTAAAAYSLAAKNPLLVLDNLEHENMTKSLNQFLLLCATGGGKAKRAGGSDSDTVEERPRALVLITAIEPLSKSELINRTFDIDFNIKKHKNQDFIETETLKDIEQARDFILSAIMQLISKELLPELNKRREYLQILRKEYSGHSKDRADEYLALLMLILEKILHYMPLKGVNDFRDPAAMAAHIRKEWIGYQNRLARDDETESNSILKLLDGLAGEYIYAMSSKDDYHMDVNGQYGFGEKVEYLTHTLPDYLIEMVMSKAQHVDMEFENKDSYYEAYLQFEATSADIVRAFDTYCRNNGARNPYDNAARLTKRLRNDLETLKRGGWVVVTKDPENDDSLYYRVIKGKRLFRLRKHLTR